MKDILKNIKILTAAELLNDESILQVEGHISQQIIKLLYSKHTNTKNYLLLDAKKIILSSHLDLMIYIVLAS